MGCYTKWTSAGAAASAVQFDARAARELSTRAAALLTSPFASIALAACALATSFEEMVQEKRYCTAYNSHRHANQ